MFSSCSKFFKWWYSSYFKHFKKCSDAARRSWMITGGRRGSQCVRDVGYREFTRVKMYMSRCITRIGCTLSVSFTQLNIGTEDIVILWQIPLHF